MSAVPLNVTSVRAGLGANEDTCVRADDGLDDAVRVVGDLVFNQVLVVLQQLHLVSVGSEVSDRSKRHNEISLEWR